MKIFYEGFYEIINGRANFKGINFFLPINHLLAGLSYLNFFPQKKNAETKPNSSQHLKINL